MPWSIFTDGGGPGSAATWAVDLLKKLGAPLTAGNEQFVYDWEVSEGGGGKFNPLNQGPVPGSPELTSTGPQYGGGAADFVSWNAGLQGAYDYVNMPAYSGVLNGLLNNDPTSARTALWDSGWASSHYGYGAKWNNSAFPGKATALPPGGQTGPGSPTSTAPTSVLGAVGNIGTDLKTIAIVGPVVLAGAALIVWGAARMTGPKPHAASAAKIGALAV